MNLSCDFNFFLLALFKNQVVYRESTIAKCFTLVMLFSMRDKKYIISA